MEKAIDSLDLLSCGLKILDIEKVVERDLKVSLCLFESVIHVILFQLRKHAAQLLQFSLLAVIVEKRDLRREPSRTV